MRQTPCRAPAGHWKQNWFMSNSTPSQTPAETDQATLALVFGFFNEIGIISQLSRNLFEQVLPDKITVPHFSVLNHFVRIGDGKTPLQLAKAFQVPKASMTNTLNGLAQHGFIESRPNPKDGRGKLIFITEQGRRFREEAIQLLAPHVKALSGQFDVQQLQSALPVLEVVRDVLDRYRETP